MGTIDIEQETIIIIQNLPQTNPLDSEGEVSKCLVVQFIIGLKTVQISLKQEQKGEHFISLE